jgi:hypothetical protein
MSYDDTVTPSYLTPTVLDTIREEAAKYGGIDGLIAHVAEVEAAQARAIAEKEAQEAEFERRNHTGRTTYSSGHNRYTDELQPDCSECDEIYAERRALVFAAARVVRDSTILQEWDDYTGNTDLSRAAVALEFVKEQGWGWRDDETGHREFYADGGDFDNRFITVTDSFRTYADDLADEMLDQARQNSDSVSVDLSRYFDYESFRRDLSFDYQTFDVGYHTIILSNA